MSLAKIVGTELWKHAHERPPRSVARIMTMCLLLTACASSWEQPPAAASSGGCSDEERSLVQSYSNALASGDMEGAKTIGQELSAKITPECVNELQYANTAGGGYVPGPTQGGYAPTEGGYVTDHGGGVMTTPDGYCSNSGCGAYGTSAPSPSDD